MASICEKNLKASPVASQVGNSDLFVRLYYYTHRFVVFFFNSLCLIINIIIMRRKNDNITKQTPVCYIVYSIMYADHWCLTARSCIGNTTALTLTLTIYSYRSRAKLAFVWSVLLLEWEMKKNNDNRMSKFTWYYNGINNNNINSNRKTATTIIMNDERPLEHSWWFLWLLTFLLSSTIICLYSIWSML